MADPTENLTSLDLLCALADLTMDQREAFVDHHVLGRTYRGIAETMGCSVGLVQYRVRRAKARLESALSPLLVAA